MIKKYIRYNKGRCNSMSHNNGETKVKVAVHTEQIKTIDKRLSRVEKLQYIILLATLTSGVLKPELVEKVLVYLSHFFV